MINTKRDDCLWNLTSRDPVSCVLAIAMIDKMGDIKLKKAAGDCLTAYAEALSLQFVLSQSYDPLKKLKAPKALADSLVWINQQLEDFGIAGLAIRELIEFLKFALGSANAAVRTNAVSVLGILRRFIGPSTVFDTEQVAIGKGGLLVRRTKKNLQLAS